MKPGATASTRAITRSAYASSSSASGFDAHVCGTHCVNIDTTCWPSGASVGSNTDGMQMSANGSAGGASGDRVLERASMSSSDSASTIVPPCTSGSKPGLAVNSGSRSTATFTFTVPLRVFHRSIVSTKSVGQRGAVDLLEERDLRMRRRDHDVGAQLLARLERHAAHASVAHVDARDGRVGAHGRAVGDSPRSRSASLTAPIPPSGKPHDAELAVADVADLVVRHHVRGARRARARPTCRSRRSPTSTPCICGDANHSSSRSAMLIVNRRVTSRDAGDAEPAQRPREPRLVDEVARAGANRARGGIVVEQRAEHVGQAAEPRVPALVRVGVGVGELRDLAWRRRDRRRGAAARGRRGTGTK